MKEVGEPLTLIRISGIAIPNWFTSFRNPRIFGWHTTFWL